MAMAILNIKVHVSRIKDKSLVEEYINQGWRVVYNCMEQSFFAVRAKGCYELR